MFMFHYIAIGFKEFHFTQNEILEIISSSIVHIFQLSDLHTFIKTFYISGQYYSIINR